MPDHRIRPAEARDLARLQAIEIAAGLRYREVGLDSVADDEPFSLETLAKYAADGRAWVVADGDDVAVGYIVIDVIDGGCHIEQVTVTPAHQGQGAGRALIDRAAAWAAERQLPVLTLSTFTHVPWNQPLYQHLGFTVVPHSERGPQMRELCAREAAHGLDPELRVVMRLEVPSARPVTGPPRSGERRPGGREGAP